jgi:hypothetical protein
MNEEDLLAERLVSVIPTPIMGGPRDLEKKSDRRE